MIVRKVGRKILVLWLLSGFLTLALIELVSAKPLYSYRDAQGTNIITDNLDRVPEQHRAKVTTVEQESDSSTTSSGLSPGVAGFMKGAETQIGGATINVPGMTPYQSHALTIAGSLALLCFVIRSFSKSQALRFLCLWGLVMLGLITPVLVYFSQDAPLDIIRGEAAHIQSKQADHLKQAQ